jgi:hypothetical protein
MTTQAPFTFHAGARPIDSHPKYRSEVNVPTNPCLITVDPRVYRGSTYSKHKPAPPDVQTAKPRRKLPSPRARETPSNSLIAPPPRTVRIDLELQTEPYLQEVVEKPEVIDISTSTDKFLDRPGTPPYIPPKTGVDIETQVEEQELFHWDFEVKPIVTTIVGKILEQAFMEVHEEEEFATIRRHKEAIEHTRNLDLAGIQRLEEQELRLFEEKQKRMEERLRYEAEQRELIRRIAARGYGEFFASDLLNDAVSALDRRGYFYDEVERDIENTFLGWLSNAMGGTSKSRIRSGLLMARTKKEAVNYELKLREGIIEKGTQIQTTGQEKQERRFRQMYVEDRAGLKIRTALEGVQKKTKVEGGEEEDESGSTG